MQKILLIGATSAIAEATARRMAACGDRLYLVGRNASRLQAIQDDLRTRGISGIESATLDANDFTNHAVVLDRAWSSLQKVDVVLIAYGTLPDQEACQASAEEVIREFGTNATSVLSLLTYVAERMIAQGCGTIAVISSVAGDRGRQSNYVYGSAKAAISTYLSGLRQRLSPMGINVLTIKPGFVDTPMTRTFKKGILWVQPDQIARGILRAIKRRRSVAYLPWFWGPIMQIIRMIPEPVFRRLRL